MKACAVALFLARAASAQVIVNVHLAKPEFIAGEPIHVVIDVTNIGGDTLWLPACCLNVELSVPDGRRRALPSMAPCHPLGGDIESFEGSSSGSPLTPTAARRTGRIRILVTRIRVVGRNLPSHRGRERRYPS